MTTLGNGYLSSSPIDIYPLFSSSWLMNTFIANSVLLLWKGELTDGATDFADYIQRILEVTTNNVTPSVVSTALHYVSIMSRQCGPSWKAPMSEYRVIVTALVLADIHLNDSCYEVKSWSQVSRMSSTEIIEMRKEFLETLNYKLSVSVHELNALTLMLREMIVSHSQCYIPKNRDPISRYPTPVEDCQRITTMAEKPRTFHTYVASNYTNN
jgi:Cyclin